MIIKKIRTFIFSHQLEILLILFGIILFVWVFLTSAPLKFKENTLFTIEEGQSLKQVGNNLKDSNLIASQSLFNSVAILTGKEDKIIAGEYLISEPLSVFEILNRITKGEYGIGVQSITLKEGFTNSEIAFTLSQTFPKFNREKFDELTLGLEGYLFPDTYFLPENADTDLILEVLLEIFNSKMYLVEDELNRSPYTLYEIITMASIVEKEATKESRQEVANILWKRIEIDMPLQVDATFVYERGLGTFDLTLDDLAEDTPYNTYINKGLPPTPIANPGLESIKAAANPKPTDNLFFLTGHDGEMYYAKTFEEHKRNKELHLW